MKRYRKIERVVAETFPGIHWEVRRVDSGPFYGYLDGYKYRLPEIATPEATESETIDAIIRNLKFWFEFRCSLPEYRALRTPNSREKT